FLTCTLHLYLHSFPTRRSSDLLTITSEFQKLVFKPWIPICLFIISTSTSTHPTLERTTTCCFIFYGCSRLYINELVTKLHFFIEDRKSTRLNSSHGSISYAVFC